MSPVIILVQPQLSENIGAVCRAMANFGLTQLRLVNPKRDWLSSAARAMAAGADALLENATIYDSLSKAAHDLTTLIATGAADYMLVKPTWTVKECMESYDLSQPIGFVFGCERTGLSQDDISRCHGLITIPTVPDFSSLNLAQAVLLVVYEYFMAKKITKTAKNPPFWGDMHDDSSPIATQKEVSYFLEELEANLDHTNFWRVDRKKPIMWRNLMNIFTRIHLSSQEVRTLIGMIKSLTKRDQ